MNKIKPNIQKCIKCELIFPEAWGLEQHTCTSPTVTKQRKI